MLTRLRINHVGDFWQEVRDMIRSYHPQPMSEADLEVVFNSLSHGGVQLWIGLEDEKDKLQVIILTLIVKSDPLLNSNTLLVYGMKTYKNIIAEEEWGKWLEVLRNFAHANGCKTICGYTEVSSLIERAQKLQGKVKSYVEFSV